MTEKGAVRCKDRCPTEVAVHPHTYTKVSSIPLFNCFALLHLAQSQLFVTHSDAGLENFFKAEAEHPCPIL
jgi:hypothetical protein